MHDDNRSDAPLEGNPFDDIELPELPIPRPISAIDAEPAPSMPTSQPGISKPIQGGASFTAVDPVAAPEPAPAVHPPRQIEPEPTDGRDPLAESEVRFAWEIAARLTSGMLSNPSKNAATVKDAVALFDQVLNEMRIYGRLASDFERLHEQEELIRVERGARFHPVIPTPTSAPVQAQQPAIETVDESGPPPQPAPPPSQDANAHIPMRMRQFPPAA